MNWKDVEGRCRDFILRYYPNVMEVLRKTTKNFSHDSRSTGSPEYEAGVLTTRPRRSVSPLWHDDEVHNTITLYNFLYFPYMEWEKSIFFNTVNETVNLNTALH
jgi:hypothetical protein